MAVYVDDMAAPYGRMIMHHMIADTTSELLAMADVIGVQRRWLQHPGEYGEHFDISKGKRQLAIDDYGAIPITWRQLGFMLRARRLTGKLCAPGDAHA